MYAKYNFIYAGIRDTLHMPVMIPNVTLVFLLCLLILEYAYMCVYTYIGKDLYSAQ